MLKHILLALCFMAYIIENIGELEPRQRKDQFDRLVKCYEQMFNLGVITTVKGIEIEIDGNFKTILIGLYKSLRINTITHSGDAPETSVNNQKRKLDTITRTDNTPETSDSNKKRKLDTITHSGDAPETSVNNKENNKRKFNPDNVTSEISVDNSDFKNENHFGIFKIVFMNRFKEIWSPEELIEKFNKMKSVENSNYPDPINKFINEYSPNKTTEYSSSVSLFCAKYSVYPTFEEPV